MYRLSMFGAQSLEYYNQIDDIGSGETPSSYQSLPDGGALDNFGGAIRQPGAIERAKSMRLSAATPAALSTLYFQLLALRGKRDKLYRKLTDGTTTHWQYARLVEMSAKRSYEQAAFKLIQDIELRFITQELFWHGTHVGAWRLDDGYYLDDGLYLDTGTPVALNANPKTFTITVGGSTDAGRAPVRDLLIIVVPGTADMSNISIARTGGETLTWNGNLRAGYDSLMIDTGRMRVVGPDNAYDNLVLAPTAELAQWFTLQPGANSLSVAFTGGGTGSTIEFVYDEAWY
jgi:hypothetical protein